MSPGGTHFKIFVIYVDFNLRPSFKFSELGWFDILALNKHLNKKSPDLSPVKALPVRVPPWAAGANPIIKIFASIAPKPVSGFPQ